jgi:hypothetical protein
MARTGLTNFVAWALAGFFVGAAVVPGGPAMLLVATSALALAWGTRFWPEGLGVAAGIAALLLWFGLAETTFLLFAGLVAGATVFVWRARGAAPAAPEAPEPPAVEGTSSRARLTVAVLIGSFALFVLDLYLALLFGLTCQSDTNHATPGSDRAGWCDALNDDRLALGILFGPSMLVFLAGLYAARRGRSREVLIAVVAGLALTIALHIPDFVLSNAAP